MKKIFRKYKIFSFLFLLCLTSCFQASNTDDCDLRTVPVTNNPNVTGHLPTQHSALPY